MNHLQTSLPPQRAVVHHHLITDDVNEHRVRLRIVRDPNVEQQTLALGKLPGNDHNRMV